MLETFTSNLWNLNIIELLVHPQQLLGVLILVYVALNLVSTLFILVYGIKPLPPKSNEHVAFFPTLGYFDAEKVPCSS